MGDLIVFLVLLALGYFFGTSIERRHYRSIIRRERVLAHIPLRTDKLVDPEYSLGFLVIGSVVVSVDYFKRVSAGIKNIFGGRLVSYETLLDRARREATLRMKEMANRYQAEEVINFRLECTSMFKQKQGSIGCIEVFAYGTALKR